MQERITTTRLAVVYASATSCRTLVLSLVPLQALEILGSAQAVSTLFFAVSALGVGASLLVPRLVRRIRARGVLAMGAVSMAVSAPLLAVDHVLVFLPGMFFHLFGHAAMEIALTLFLMAIVPHRELSYFEPKRVVYTASSYMIGPFLGVLLANHVWFYLPFVLVVLSALLTLGLMAGFGLFRLVERPPRERRGSSWWGNVVRFASQPRLRLAWALTLGRAVWWSVFFIYTPIYAVTYGLGETAGAALVSAGVGIVLTVNLWGALGRRVGLRRLLTAAFLVTGLLTLSVALAVEYPWLAAALLLATAVAVTPLDAAGNIPFLRAVRPHERAEMTGVFATYRDTSQLAPPGLFAVLLRYFELPVVYLTIGVAMLSLAGLARYLPRRL